MDETGLIQAVRTISEYCKNHICTQCPLNIGDKNNGILKAHCVCDYNILHLPSTWKVEELKSNEQ